MKGLDIPEYDLNGEKGSHNSAIVTTGVKGIKDLMTHSEYVDVSVEPVTGYSEHIATARSYGVLKPGRGKIDVCLRNRSAKQITLPKETAVGEITAANILALLALKPTGHKEGKGESHCWKGET